MKKIIVAVALILVFITTGSTLAEVASDKEIVKSFSDHEIKDAKALLRQVEKDSFEGILEETRATLDKIERMQLDGDKTWKSLIMKAYLSSWRLYKKKPSLPETSFLVARALFFNGRPDKAKRALKKTFYYDGKYVDAHILKVDIGLEDAKNDIEQFDDGVDFFQIEQARKRYEKVLLLKGVDDDAKSKVFMKIGDLYADMALNKKKSEQYWQKSYDAAPDSFWGKRSKARISEAN